MKLIEFAQENRNAVAFAFIVLIVGTSAYFSLGAPNSRSMAELAPIYAQLEIKMGFAENGEIKLFAYLPPEKLSMLSAAEGKSLPDSDSMVLGSGEAAMMRKEKLIEGAGSRLSGFFGIDTSIAGVLGKTGSPLDMMHFLSRGQFDEIDGKKGKVSILLKGTMPKLFYYMEQGEQVPRLSLASGSAENYREEEGYCPIFIGSEEAKMMISEGLISGAGSRIDGFFGMNVKVAGILEKTNSTLDMMHFVPEECGIS